VVAERADVLMINWADFLEILVDVAVGLDGADVRVALVEQIPG